MNFSKCLKLFFQNNKHLLLVTFLAGIFVYGYALTEYSLTIDDEEFIDRSMWFIQDGRFTLTFITQALFRGTVIPYVPLILSIVFMSINGVLISRLLNLKNPQSYIFSLLFISFPSFFYIFQFTTNAMGVAIGILLSIISLILFLKSINTKFHIIKYITSIILLTFSIGTYQSIIFFPPYILLLLLYNGFITPGSELPGNQKFILNIAIFAFYMITALALYYFITYYICKKIYGVPLSPRLTGLINITLLDPLYELKEVYTAIGRHYLGLSYYGESIFITIIAAVAINGVKIFREYMQRGKRLGYAYTMLLIILLFPFTLDIMHEGNLPARIQLCQSLEFATLWTFAINTFKRDIARTIAYGLIGICLFYSATHASRLYFSDQLAWQANRVFATQLAGRIEMETGINITPVDNSIVKISIWGTHQIMLPSSPAKSDTFGASFFSWDGGNLNRMLSFMRVNGIANLHGVYYWQLSDIQKDAYKSMASWPKQGCIRVVEDCILVKLSENRSVYQ